jgi:archaellin
MKNIKKIFIPLIFIFLLLSIIFTAGCIEIGRQTQTENYVIGKVTVTEITYFLGDDGLFTKIYVLSFQTIGSSPIIRTLSRAQYEEIKNTPVGYFLPDYLNPDSSSQITPYITPYNKQITISIPIPKTQKITYTQVIKTTTIPTYTPKTQQLTYTQVTQMPTSIQMIGNVYGIASNPSSGIDEIRFTIGLAPGAPAIDLTKMKIVFSTLSTSSIVLTQGAIASTSVFTTKLDGNNVNTMYIFNPDEITFKIAPVKANTKIFIELRPSVGAPLPFSKTTPSTISKMNVLY